MSNFGFKRKFDREHGRTVAVAECESCRKAQSINIANDPPPLQIVRKFHQHGWQMGERKKTLCLACLTHPKETPVNKPMSQIVTPSTPRDLTPLEAAKVVMALEENFDKVAGCYIGNIDDKALASQINIPWACLQKFREEAGYTIKADPAIAALKKDIQAWMAMGDDMRLRLEALEKRK